MILFIACGSASAGTIPLPIQFTVSNTNSGGISNCGFSGTATCPGGTAIGTVTLAPSSVDGSGNITGLSVTISLNAINGGTFTFISPDGKDISWNGLGTAATSNITGLTGYNFGSSTPNSLVYADLQHGDNVSINGQNITFSNTMFQITGAAMPINQITFNLTPGSGTTWTYAQLQNASFALHLGWWNTSLQSNASTGFVGTGGGTIISPEPGTLQLLGSALLLGGGYFRRKFMK